MKYYLGKCDYEGKGLTNLGEVEWKIKDGEFTASGGIWNSRKNDYVTCGQCLDTLLEYFPNDKLLPRIIAVWNKWHLNKMTAGSPRQEAFLAKQPNPTSDHFTWARDILEANDLNPDTEYEYQGKPYQYGSAWLERELPNEVIEEINSWEQEVSSQES